MHSRKPTVALFAVSIMLVSGCALNQGGKEVTVLTTEQRFGADCEFVGLVGRSRENVIYTLKFQALQAARNQAADLGANAVRLVSKDDSIGRRVIAEALRCDPATWNRKGKRTDPINADALKAEMTRDELTMLMGGGPVRVMPYGEPDRYGDKDEIWIFERWTEGRGDAPAEALWVYMGSSSARVVRWGPPESQP